MAGIISWLRRRASYSAVALASGFSAPWPAAADGVKQVLPLEVAAAGVLGADAGGHPVVGVAQDGAFAPGPGSRHRCCRP